MLHIQAFLKDKNVSSVAATSKFCVQRILSRIKFRPNQTIIEYGPGDGVLTKALLKRISRDSKLIAIETNSAFVRDLKKRFQDPRLIVVHDTAENVLKIIETMGISSADCVISGIPFSLLSLRTKRRLINDTRKLLSVQGIFLVYQALTAPRARLVTKRCLSKEFTIANEKFLLPNLPPLYLLEAVPAKNA